MTEFSILGGVSL